ncbi:hypothetical protein PRZ48_003131 [Zasmidium cellare]|uniref:Zn(2)-C6 fungal-type domain-containing protein n=1 Tax=Zasmidium cellare TaxID=395010 RepID=A0ABR0EVR6_ZASCE|nr:hypothetical protein PRZ48_003131 [Zasmidium cellare]
MSTGLSRRNGKAASCEPCRKAKIRCDHQKPCGRCTSRGLTARCIYHPAPLTRPRRPGSGQILDFTTATYQWDGGSHSTPSSHEAVNHPITPASGISDGLPLRMTWPSRAVPTYQQGQQPPRLLNTISSDGPELENLQTVKYILSQLRHFEFLDHLINEYGSHAQAILVPSPIVRRIMNELRPTKACLAMEDFEGHSEKLNSLAKLVLSNSSKPVQYPDEFDVDKFVSLYTGENLRLETMGLVFAISVRAFLLGLAGDDHKREDFVHEMCTTSFACLRLGRELCTDISDMEAFLSFEDHRRTSVTEGDATPAVWRKLGEAITDIYAAGIHRERNNAKLPFFLAECRRKVYAHLFRSDKFIATLMELPPRMIRRYSDTRLPLNLTDDELLAAANEQEARRTLTPDGWNIDNVHMPTTWTRARCMLAENQEEILDHLNRPIDAGSAARLHRVLDESYQRWNSLPEHTHYSPECWNNGITMPICLMLSTLRQAFLQGIFSIYRTLEPIEPSCSPELLKVSMDIVLTAHDVGRNLNRAIFLRYDFPYVVLCYGLPAAGVLVNALLEVARSKGTQSLPEGLNRAFIIRQLSVFISHLESIYNPGDPNYTICLNAAKAISRTLDDALDISAASTTVNSTAGPQTPASNNDVGATLAPAMPLMLNNERNGMDLDILSSNGLDGFDFATWMKDIDWTGTGGEWSNL